MSNKTLIVYVYFETQETKENFNFFIKNGIIENNSYHYIIIINNNNLTLDIPNFNNIKTYCRNENDFDFFTYKWGINKLINDNIDLLSFNTYYFINSSCIGPFIPPIISTYNWIDLFNKKLEKYDLFAPIIEIPPDTNGYRLLNINTTKNIPFLHTYFIGLNNTGFIIFKDILDNIEDNNDKKQTCINIERIITAKFLYLEKKIGNLLLKFKNVDMNNDINWNCKLFNNNNKSCYEIPENYFGIDIHPFEVIFVKNIRNTHEHRRTGDSGISKTLYKQIHNYKNWY